MDDVYCRVNRNLALWKNLLVPNDQLARLNDIRRLELVTSRSTNDPFTPTGLSPIPFGDRDIADVSYELSGNQRHFTLLGIRESDQPSRLLNLQAVTGTPSIQLITNDQYFELTIKRNTSGEIVNFTFERPSIASDFDSFGGPVKETLPEDHKNYLLQKLHSIYEVPIPQDLTAAFLGATGITQIERQTYAVFNAEEQTTLVEFGIDFSRIIKAEVSEALAQELQGVTQIHQMVTNNNPQFLALKADGSYGLFRIGENTIWETVPNDARHPTLAGVGKIQSLKDSSRASFAFYRGNNASLIRFNFEQVTHEALGGNIIAIRHVISLPVLLAFTNSDQQPVLISNEGTRDHLPLTDQANDAVKGFKNLFFLGLDSIAQKRNIYLKAELVDGSSVNLVADASKPSGPENLLDLLPKDQTIDHLELPVSLSRDGTQLLINGETHIGN